MKLYSIGEALIDFLPYNEGFLPVVGGAPANVASCVARLGGDAYFVGKVGEDMFGEKILQALSKAGVHIDYATKTNKANTALSFVSLKENGEREFSFYRNPSADMFLEKADIANITFEKEDILHFCSVDLLDMPVKKATITAIKKIKTAGGLVSFDPNIRKNLWNDHDEYKQTIKAFLPQADIVKISDDECEFIFGYSDTDTIAKRLLNTAKIVIVTLGEKGSMCFTSNQKTYQKAYKIKCIDTTGAGDSFIGSFLYFLNNNSSNENIEHALQKAAATSAIVCTKKGVLDSLPSKEQLQKFMNGGIDG